MEGPNECDLLKFSEFCQVCEKICSAANKKLKAVLMRKFINSFNRNSSDYNFFPILRLLVPHLERERGPYGLKEHNLAKLYIRTLCLPKDGNDANKLMHYRAPQAAGSAAGDFGEVVYWVVRNRCGEDSQFTVGDVNKHLDNIAMKHSSHDPRGVDSEFVIMQNAMSAQEQKWLVRIILKDMVLSLGTKHILSMYHPDSQEMYDLSNSLLKVCTELKDPQIPLHELEIKLFQPFRPMLSERCDIQELSFKGTYYVETKLDGERFQLHYKDRKFKYFSRNGYDNTNNFGEDSESGHVTKLIQRQLFPSVESCILDGEMMVWHSERHCFVTKGQNTDVKLIRAGSKQPCFCAFDVLMYNGLVLTNKPLQERLGILKKIFTPLEGVIMHTQRSIVKDSDDVLKAVNEAIDTKEEGVVLKDPYSIYKPNGRKAGWYKIKPEYTEGAMVDLDLLIIGGYFGEGKKRSIISHFLLGLQVPNETKSAIKFQSLCRVGSGYTLDELAELNEKLQSNWVKFIPSKCPPFILIGKEKPDLWINPEKSYILQVRATEVVPSDFFYTGCTLRFVRVERVRYDKPWNNCLTTVEFDEIRRRYSGKLTAGHISKRQFSRKRKSQQSVSPGVIKRDYSGIERISSIFEGREICVISGTDTVSQDQLKKMIIKNGGTITDKPNSKTFCIIMGNTNIDIRAKNIINAKKHNVIHCSWIEKCNASSCFINWNPHDVISSTLKLSSKLSENYDVYGDSYMEPSSPETVQKVLQRVNISCDDVDKMTVDEMRKMDFCLFNGPSLYSVFRECRAYFDFYEDIGNCDSPKSISLTTESLLFIFLGGKIDSEITSSTSHVIIHSSHRRHLQDFKDLQEKSDNPFYLITHEWILNCWESRLKLSENDFTP